VPEVSVGCSRESLGECRAREGTGPAGWYRAGAVCRQRLSACSAGEGRGCAGAEGVGCFVLRRAYGASHGAEGDCHKLSSRAWRDRAGLEGSWLGTCKVMHECVETPDVQADS